MRGLRELIARSGPIAVSEYIDRALYDPDDGFYATTGRAGRRGDFLTAPEVGPLFGAVVARALDAWWTELERPDPFTVVDWGAGPGTLERAILGAEPACLLAGALRLVAVEGSASQRAGHPDHPAVESVATLESEPVIGVIIANELLDNLAFDIVERTDSGWVEVRVDVDEAGDLTTVDRPAGPGLVTGIDRLLNDVPAGTWVPVQEAARTWLDRAVETIERGRVVVFDYGADLADLVARPGHGWLRTHRAHDDTGDWLSEPGSCDITVDVAFDALQDGRPASETITQAEFLRRHGIDDLVDEGRRRWEEGAERGDLAALAGRSRVREAEALLDPAGMGDFVVATWAVRERRVK